MLIWKQHGSQCVLPLLRTWITFSFFRVWRKLGIIMMVFQIAFPSRGMGDITPTSLIWWERWGPSHSSMVVQVGSCVSGDLGMWIWGLLLSAITLWLCPSDYDRQLALPAYVYDQLLAMKPGNNPKALTSYTDWLELLSMTCQYGYDWLWLMALNGRYPQLVNQRK